MLRHWASNNSKPLPTLLVKGRNQGNNLTQPGSNGLRAGRRGTEGRNLSLSFFLIVFQCLTKPNPRKAISVISTDQPPQATEHKTEECVSSTGTSLKLSAQPPLCQNTNRHNNAENETPEIFLMHALSDSFLQLSYYVFMNLKK